MTKQVTQRKDTGTFFDNEAGATAIEYGLIVALIAVAISGVVFALGTSMAAKFQVAVNYLTQ